MRKLLLVCVMAASAAVANAQNTMVVHSANDATKSGTKLEEINKLTFAGNKMVVEMNNGAASKTYDLNAFNKVTFESTSVNIAGTTVEREGLKFSFDGSIISVSGLKEPAAAVVYDASGAAMESLAAWDGKRLSVASLPKGMYMLSVNGVAYKFLKK